MTPTARADQRAHLGRAANACLHPATEWVSVPPRAEEVVRVSPFAKSYVCKDIQPESYTSDYDPLHLVERNFVISPIIKSRCPSRLMAGNLLRHFHAPIHSSDMS